MPFFAGLGELTDNFFFLVSTPITWSPTARNSVASVLMYRN
jgi:hypothetical protein